MENSSKAEVHQFQLAVLNQIVESMGLLDIHNLHGLVEESTHFMKGKSSEHVQYN